MLTGTHMSATHLTRSLAFGVLLAAGLFAAGCAATPADADAEQDESGADAITRDERITRYVTRKFPSVSPAETGVDAWDYAVVENAKTGDSYAVLIALSTRGGAVKPLFELALVDGGEAQIQARSVDAEGTALALRKERMKAIRADILKMSDTLGSDSPCSDSTKKSFTVSSLASFAVAIGAGAVCIVALGSPAAAVAYPVCYAAMFGGSLAGTYLGIGAAYCSLD